jgi:hypothetical protein
MREIYVSLLTVAVAKCHFEASELKKKGFLMVSIKNASIEPIKKKNFVELIR